MEKQCIFLDYKLSTYQENVDGTGLASPENTRIIAVGENDNVEKGVVGDPQRIVLTRSYLVHIVTNSADFTSDDLKLTITRAVECGTGCRSSFFSVTVPFCGSGMMLPEGEYTITIEDQEAKWLSPEKTGESYPLTLLFEPADHDMIQAVVYNYVGGIS